MTEPFYEVTHAPPWKFIKQLTLLINAGWLHWQIERESERCCSAINIELPSTTDLDGERRVVWWDTTQHTVLSSRISLVSQHRWPRRAGTRHHHDSTQSQYSEVRAASATETRGCLPLRRVAPPPPPLPAAAITGTVDRSDLDWPFAILERCPPPASSTLRLHGRLAMCV